MKIWCINNKMFDRLWFVYSDPVWLAECHTPVRPAHCLIWTLPSSWVLFIIRVLHARLTRGAHTRYGLKIIPDVKVDLAGFICEEKWGISWSQNCRITYTSLTIILLVMPYGSTHNRQSSCCPQKLLNSKSHSLQTCLAFHILVLMRYGINFLFIEIFMLFNVKYW